MSGYGCTHMRRRLLSQHEVAIYRLNKASPPLRKLCASAIAGAGWIEAILFAAHDGDPILHSYCDTIYLCAARIGNAKLMKIARQQSLDYNTAYDGFVIAVASGNLRCVQLGLRDVNMAQIRIGITRAIYCGKLRAMKYICLRLKRGLKPDHYLNAVNYSFHDAVMYGRVQSMKLLRSLGANRFDQAMFGGCEHNNAVHVMRLLKQWGATAIDAVAGLAAKNNWFKTVKALCKIGASDLPDVLHVAEIHGHADIAAYLKKRIARQTH